jgi:hypothetical protein
MELKVVRAASAINQNLEKEIISDAQQTQVDCDHYLHFLAGPCSYVSGAGE